VHVAVARRHVWRRQSFPDFKQAQLLRTMDDGSKEAITIPVHQVFKGVAADGALKDEDVLYVAISRARLVTVQAIASAVGLGTGVLLYRTTQ